MSSKQVKFTSIQVERLIAVIDEAIEIEEGLMEDDPTNLDIYEDSVSELEEIKFILEEEE